MKNTIMRLITFFTVCFLACVFVAQADEVTITPVQVTEQIYMIAGKGGNVGVFIGDDGTFLIDDNFAPLTEKIVEAVKKIGGDYPKFLINTHYHGDHTGGNENLGGGGTLIFSHDNVRERLKKGAFLQAFNSKMEAVEPEGLPVVTFADGIRFFLNGDTVRVVHVAHAHTDGDSYIYFEKANVLHSGDLLFNGFYPFIDVNHGGSLIGIIKGVDEILSLIDDETKLIPGHGPLGDKKQLQDYRVMLSTAYERLKKLKTEGKTWQEAVEAKPLEDLEEIWGDGLFTGERWIELVYPEV